MMRNESLYLECYSGISGDMFAAALLDLGADEMVLHRALDSLPISGFRTEISRVKKAGLDACDFAVILDEAHENHDHDMAYLYGAAAHPHVHDHDDTHTSHAAQEHAHAHRTLSDILEILNQAALTERAREIAVRIFTILADAEAKAHGTTREQVHFHEVGAVDSIVDIAAAAVCLDNLGVEEVIVPVLYEGIGSVRAQHGMLPIPVPAVVHIAAQHHLTLHITAARGEYITPTGAAIAAAVCTGNRLPAAFTVERIGLGAGKREQEMPGLLRAMLIHAAAEDNVEEDSIYKLESNIDDSSGEALGYVMECLLAAGARDVHYGPIFMKKNRPSYLLTVLCTEEDVPDMERIIFAETTSIGIRRIRMERSILKRSLRSIETSLGIVQVKECDIPIGNGRTKKRRYPEYESVAALCKKTGLSYQDACRQIMKELL